jgi:TRAP-type C4-dicarboxylate transport system permease small subunit
MQRLAEGLAGAAVLVEQAIRHLMAAVIAVLVLLNVAATVGRYARWYTWPWADEVLLFTLVWGIGLGLYAVTLRGGHLAMDLVAQRLPARMRDPLQAVVATASFALIAFVAVQSHAFIQAVAAADMRSMTGEIPMAIPHSGLLAGFLLMLLALALRAVLAVARVPLPPQRGLVPDAPPQRGE